ncbi:MAG: ABC transporter substrate-binding protein [Acidimicrobiia bacterium]
MVRTRLSLVLLVALSLVAATCGEEEGAEPPAGGVSCAKADLNLVEPGVLTVATGEPAFLPWVMDDNPTNKQGFEAAVAYEIATELGFADTEVKWVRTGFDEAIAPGPKNFDFNLQQYSITPVRDEVVDFSKPYYVTRQAVIAFPDSPVVGATTIADLKDTRLGAQIGTTSLDFIEDVIQPTQPAAVYDTTSDAKSAMEADQVDGILVDLPTAYFITAVEIEDAVIAGQFEAAAAAPDEYGLLFAEGNPLVACVNQAIDALIADGTLAALESAWLAQEGAIPTITS